ncbi:MAG: hypothetical protein R3E65_09760 [Steroidobacteraceae bacterium]
MRRLRGLLWSTLFAATLRRERDSSPEPEFQTLIRGGTVCDGSGAPPFIRRGLGARARRRDRRPVGARARDEIDARRLTVAPGFINMLSWATESLLVDPRGESDLRQGVTLEVFGEGVSMGPLTPAMRHASRRGRRITASTSTGPRSANISTRSNGAASRPMSRRSWVRRRCACTRSAMRQPARADELARMCEQVRIAMREGALGVGSALIYAPATCASHEELRALALAAAEYGGAYISHVRSESGRLLEAIDEVIDIARTTRRHAEIYHFKVAGEANWPLLDAALARIEAARAEVWMSPPTCIRTSRRRRDSMPACRRGCRKAGTRPGWRGCAIP